MLGCGRQDQPGKKYIHACCVVVQPIDDEKKKKQIHIQCLRHSDDFNLTFQPHLFRINDGFYCLSNEITTKDDDKDEEKKELSGIYATCTSDKHLKIYRIWRSATAQPTTKISKLPSQHQYQHLFDLLLKI